MYSMGDIIAQILNKAILNGLLTEEETSIYKVIARFPKEDEAQDLESAVKKLISSDAFLYIGAFVNTIKHRTLIGMEFRIDSTGRNLRLHDFDYHEKHYPITSAETITIGYLNEIEKLIGDIINETIKYLGTPRKKVEQ